jgi:solute carrier family 41
VHVSEVFILCPALLGLKGNLEMVLASRLSTASNMGRLSLPAQQWDMVKGNLLLMQVQAIIVALAASIFSIVMGIVFHHEFSLRDTLLIAASAISTASIASVLLG